MSSSKTKKQQAQTTRNTAAITKASSLDLSKSLNALSTSGVTIQGTLSKISEELITQHAELQAVGDAIALKKAEMEALHGVDQVLLTLDEARENHRLNLEQMKKELDEAKQAHTLLVQQNAQNRARDEANYGYDLQQRRKAETNEWEEEMRLRRRDELIIQEKFEKGHAERELALRQKETEYQQALAKLATFDAEVKKETDSRVIMTANSLKQEFQHKTELATIQHKSDIDRLSNSLNILATTLADKDASIKDLQAQLKAAHDANASLAAKAVEGASNKQAQAEAMAVFTNIGGSNGARPPRS